MKILKRILLFVINIIVNGVVLWFIANKVPELGFNIESIYKDTYIIFWILWLLFWLINTVLKRILKILTLPIRIVTVGLFSFILNIAILYIFEQTVNFLDIGITVELGTLIKTVILSVIISIIYFVIKKII